MTGLFHGAAEAGRVRDACMTARSLVQIAELVAKIADAIPHPPTAPVQSLFETDARTDTEACDLADELEEAPSFASWPALLVILREVAPDGAEALVAAAEAAERAWDRAPELDVDAILAKAKAAAEAAANGAAH